MLNATLKKNQDHLRYLGPCCPLFFVWPGIASSWLCGPSHLLLAAPLEIFPFGSSQVEELVPCYPAEVRAWEWVWGWKSKLSIFTGAKEDVTGGLFSVFSSVCAGDDSETSGLNAYLCEQLPTCCFRNKEMWNWLTLGWLDSWQTHKSRETPLSGLRSGWHQRSSNSLLMTSRWAGSRRIATWCYYIWDGARVNTGIGSAAYCKNDTLLLWFRVCWRSLSIRHETPYLILCDQPFGCAKVACFHVAELLLAVPCSHCSCSSFRQTSGPLELQPLN